MPVPSDEGHGRDGFKDAVEKILQYSVNTWDQGFLDKLYSSTTPVGLAADLVLSALNSNVHVYSVSPALTIIEKQTAKALAEKIGFTGGHAGGVSQPGGSAANLSALVIARNNLFPEIKTDGLGDRRLVIFTSAHGHYSIEKAAQISGLGAKAVRTVAVDEKGQMRPNALEEAIKKATDAGETPFFVNATAGTTVLGAFDPLDAISEVTKRHKLWLHVDASWGGPVMFSPTHRSKLRGSEHVDSFAVCPHKMLGVPLTCSFLLGQDLRQFRKGMSLPAEYLFHGDDLVTDAEGLSIQDEHGSDNFRECWDLADLTPQCGRRGDSLKLALTWLYYGTSGLAAHIDQGFAAAALLAKLVSEDSRFRLVSENPPPCLQVCFYYVGDKKEADKEGLAATRSRVTAEIVKRLVPRGFMTDYAPGECGKFLRVVVNGQTRASTVEGLVRAIAEVGEEVVDSK